MSITIEMPKLSDTMTEGTLVRWIKKVGDTVEVGDVLAEVETDKATMEMEAFDEGVLSEVYVQEGQKVEIGQRLALLTSAGEQAPAPDAKKPAKEGQDEPAATAAKEAPVTAKEAPARKEEREPLPEAKRPETDEEAREESIEVPGGRLKASPLARKIAAELGVELGRVQGSGPSGRIIRDDVLAAARGSTKPAKTQPPISKPVAKPEPIAAAAEDKKIPLSGMRKGIAARLLESKTTIPHFYLQAEIDAEPMVRLRQEINAAAEDSGIGKITVNDFILKATAVAAGRVPLANAAFSGDAVIQFANVQLACAVAVEEGLVTPVIRQAQTKTLSQISAEIKDLASRARSKKLKPEEYQGGTITVSNLGGYGIEQFFAIINPPQAVIVSVGAIVKKPVVAADDRIIPAQRMSVSLSCDHRVVDGAVGAQFLAELKKLLEAPALMLI